MSEVNSPPSPPLPKASQEPHLPKTSPPSTGFAVGPTTACKIPLEPKKSCSSRASLAVSALLTRDANSRALLVLAHGAGAGMQHPHLERLVAQLCVHNIATLRYQFPYMEKGSRRPDRPAVLEETVQAAVRFAKHLAPALPLFAGGRSMGARMTARAHAGGPLPVLGLVFFAFPLHRAVNLRASDPTLERASHLLQINDPMLFLAGTRDRLARLHLLEQTVAQVRSATLHVVDTADHSFVPTKKSGRALSDVEEELAAVAGRWMMSRF